MINTGIEVLLCGLIAAVLAQLIKFVAKLITKGQLDFHVLTTTGGMPSAHSAVVVSMATSVGLIKGFSSVEFAMILGYALVVMYDAAGLRRAAGKMAVCLNRLIQEIYKHNPSQAGEKLKELLGHTPIEVFMGAMFGALIALVVHFKILV